MVQFKVSDDGKIIEARDEYSREPNMIKGRDAKNMSAAITMANWATRDLGELFLAVDRGSSVHPRYDVIRAPKVGEKVSYGFNGDYYPDGVITKVGGTDCSRVYTDTGSVYNRRRKTGSWIKRGGTWCMVMGHIDERNPSF